MIGTAAVGVSCLAMVQILGSVQRELPTPTIWVTQVIIIRTCCERCAAFTTIGVQQRRLMQHAVWRAVISAIRDDDPRGSILVRCSWCKALLSHPFGRVGSANARNSLES